MNYTTLKDLSDPFLLQDEDAKDDEIEEPEEAEEKEEDLEEPEKAEEEAEEDDKDAGEEL